MVSVENIHAAMAKVKSGKDFPKFVQEIKAMGIVRNDVYVGNGLSIFFDQDNQAHQLSPEAYPELVINEESSSEKLAHALEIHQQGETDYFTFCKQAADAGVEKWVIDLEVMTCTYFDAEGNVLIEESIPAE